MEITLTISHSTGEPVSMESNIKREVSLSITETSEIGQLKIRTSVNNTLSLVEN